MRQIWIPVILVSATLVLADDANVVWYSQNDPVLKLTPYNETFRDFKRKYSKVYGSKTEENHRFKIFVERARTVEQHNKAYMNGKTSFYLAINTFADFEADEYLRLLGFKRSLKKNMAEGSTYLSPSNVQLPDFVDWRKEGYVTDVKNQGDCGSCWSFIATGALEGQHYKKTGELLSLSEQQLLDCSSSFGNDGCNGGSTENAFTYIKLYGSELESVYPYEEKVGECRYQEEEVFATCNGYVELPGENEAKLKEAVATVGPIAAAIDADKASFMLYSGGIYNEENCSSVDLSHGVLVVGYGSTDGDDYWLVKNSWGEDWGEKGYIKMSRNKNNQCGIASQNSYPLV